MRQIYGLVKDRLAEIEEIKARTEEIIAQGQCFSVRDLAVNSRDVIATGIAPDPEVGRILSSLLEQVLSGEVPNDREILLGTLHP